MLSHLCNLFGNRRRPTSTKSGRRTQPRFEALEDRSEMVWQASVDAIGTIGPEAIPSRS